MTTISKLFKTSKYREGLTQDQDVNPNQGDDDRSQQETPIPNSKVANTTEQDYYNKASGCSVKAQKDNLFDYASFLKL